MACECFVLKSEHMRVCAFVCVCVCASQLQRNSAEALPKICTRTRENGLHAHMTTMTSAAVQCNSLSLFRCVCNSIQIEGCARAIAKPLDNTIANDHTITLSHLLTAVVCLFLSARWHFSARMRTRTHMHHTEHGFDDP